MKKKVLLLSLALMLALTGVVSAAAAWGKYKGYDIIRLTVDGNTVKATDAPAISFNNRTMVPIYMLKDAGVKYSWDEETKTVEVQKQNNATTGLDWKGIFKHLKNYKVYALDIGLTDDIDAITADYNGLPGNITDADYGEIIYTLAYSDASYFQIFFNDGSSYSYTSSIVRNYFEGKISQKQMHDSATIILK